MNTTNSAAAKQRWDEILEDWRRMRELPEPAREAALQALCGGMNWYAMLRLVQCAYPDLPRLGYGPSPLMEPVRLGQPLFFHPPSTTLAAVVDHGPKEKRWGEPDVLDALAGGTPGPGRDGTALLPAWIYSHHLGMFGPHGPLPLHLTEYAHQRVREQDAAFFAFCNVLTHRFLSFFFRAWAEARKEMAGDRIVALERSGHGPARRDIGEHGEEWWSFFVGSLIGCGLDSLRSRDRVAEKAKLYYAGRLLQVTRGAEGLRAIVEDYFELPARVLEFQSRTLPIPEAAQWQMGLESSTGYLGLSTMVGASVVDYQSGFRVRLGPLSLDELERFLPGTDGFKQLQDWVRYYSGRETDANPDADVPSAWDLQLVLRASEVPPIALDDQGVGRLGWTTWLHSYTPRVSAEEIRDFSGLVAKLKRREDKVAALLFGRFSEETKKLLQSRARDSSTLCRMETALTNELNRVIEGDPIYDPFLFEGVTLAAETRLLIDESPKGRDLQRLNRALLEHVFPGELFKNPAPPNWQDAEDLVLEPLPDGGEATVAE